MTPQEAYQRNVLDQALKYYQLGLSIFPLEYKSKRPFFEKLPLIGEKRKWEPFGEKRADEQQIREWFSSDFCNIAIVQGAVSGNLVVMDFDEEPIGVPLAEYMMGEKLENLGAKTIVVKTKKGAHVYLRTDAPVEYEKFDNLTPAIKMEIRADVHYVVAPPSIHPDSGQPYAFIGPGEQIMTIRTEQYKKWRSDLDRKLEEWPYVREILPYWKAPLPGKPETGGRQNLCLGVAAFFRKILKWSQERAEQIIRGICLVTEDEEERQRINAVQSTYHKEDIDTVGTQKWLGEDLFTLLKNIPRPKDKPKKKTRKTIHEVEAETKKRDPQSVVVPLSDPCIDYALWTPTAVSYCRIRLNAPDDARVVIKNPPRPIRRLLVDDDIYFEYEHNGKIITAKVDDLLSLLKGEGCVLSVMHAMDVLSAVTTGMTNETVRVHATYGVYDENGQLMICEQPHPVKDEQSSVWESILASEALSCEPTAEKLLAYIDILSHWHPYECLPSIGLGLAGPFTPITRRHGMLVPHLDLWSPEHDLGKSLVTFIASTQLYSVGSISGEDINSPYRVAAHLDSICLPLPVEEADRLKPGVNPTLKQSAERWSVTKRGQTSLEMLKYNSRATLQLSGNTPALGGSPAELKRWLVDRFDSSAKAVRRKGNIALERAFEDLQPIGYGLIRWWVLEHPTVDELLTMLKDWREEIRKAKETWVSPKRAEEWAIVYFGLKIFEHGCKKCGLDMPAPTITEFVKTVVTPVEDSTWAVERSIASRFASWFLRDIAVHERTQKTVTKEEGFTTIGSETVRPGEDQIWRQAGGLVKVGGRLVPGWFVTDSIVDTYNNFADDGYHVTSLIELAKQGADEGGIPYDQVLDSDNVRVRKVAIGDRKLRAAFVPECLVGGDTSWIEALNTDGSEPPKTMPDDEGTYPAEWKRLYTKFPQVPISSHTLGTTNIDDLDSTSFSLSSQVPMKSRARVEEADEKAKKAEKSTNIYARRQNLGNLGTFEKSENLAQQEKWFPSLGTVPKVLGTDIKSSSHDMGTSVKPIAEPPLNIESAEELQKALLDLQAKVSPQSLEHEFLILQWALKEAVNNISNGDRIGAYLLRSDGMRKYPANSDSVARIIDTFYSQIESIAKRIVARKKVLRQGD